MAADDRERAVRVRGGLVDAWRSRLPADHPWRSLGYQFDNRDVWPLVIMMLLVAFTPMVVWVSLLRLVPSLLDMAPDTIARSCWGIAFLVTTAMAVGCSSRRVSARWSLLRLPKGQCLACGYDLRRCAREPDGCTVCPECGAAWKLPTPAATDGNSAPT